MKTSWLSYKKLSAIAAIVMIGLVSLQLYWLWQAAQLQQRETYAKMTRLVTDLALEINQLNPHAFRIDSLGNDEALLADIQSVVDSFLHQHELSASTQFAFYQGTSQRILMASSPSDHEALLASDIRVCMNCIISFSVLPGGGQRPNETDQAFQARINSTQQFQYFSPVDQIKQGEEVLWFALYQPRAFQAALQSLFYVFVANLLLLLVFLLLFYSLLRSFAQAKQLGAVKDDFFNNMTHEFKTPLSSIRLANRMLQKRVSSPDQHSYTQLIEKESFRLETQIDKLLMLSLWEKDGPYLDQGSFPIHEVLAEVSQRMKLLLQEKGASLIITGAWDPPTLAGDKAHFGNALCNLIDNSLKYGGEPVEIDIIVQQDGGTRTLIVQDNGPGIPAMHQAHIFERFYRAQSGNEYKGRGVGIGLSYVQSVVQAHRGQIEIDPGYEAGCRFTLTF